MPIDSKKGISFVIILGVILVFALMLPSLTSKSPNLTVSDQALADNQMEIDSFYIDKPGYVVLHADADGPGAVIGHSDLVEGSYRNFRIVIDPEQAGNKIWVMLHYDDDGDGEYGFPDEDRPVRLEDGVLVKPINLL